jgi:hypothetical protein
MDNIIRFSEGPIAEIAKAMTGFQAAVANPKSTEDNPFFGSKYADLANILRTIKKPLIDHGLSVLQGATTEEIANTSTGEVKAIVAVETILLHSSGQFARFTCRIVADRYGKDGKAQPMTAQSVGSAITYGRRYSIAAMLGVAQEDDDGNAASGKDGTGKQPAPAFVDRRPRQQAPQGTTPPDETPSLTGEQVVNKIAEFYNTPGISKDTVLKYFQARKPLIAKLPEDQRKAIRAGFDLLMRKIEAPATAPAPETPNKKEPPAQEKQQAVSPDEWTASLKLLNEAIQEIAVAKTEAEVKKLVEKTDGKLVAGHKTILDQAATGRIGAIKTK